MAVLLRWMSFMLSVFYPECRKQTHYAECHYAECHYAECRCAECRGALTDGVAQDGGGWREEKK
jgi:hypothetical protein